MNGSAEYLGFGVKRLDEINPQVRAAVVQALGLDEGAVVAIVGVPNGGKTALGIDLSLHCAANAARWLGLKIAGGPVLYCASEAPGSVVTRARAAKQRKFADQAVAYYITSAVPALGGEDTSGIDTDRLIETVEHVASLEGQAVKMVFIDTLASCLGDGEENGDGMIRLVNAAKSIANKTKACVVLIHHPSKGDASGLRGHGSLAAACDSIIRIDVDELTNVRTATLIKARDCATGLQLRYELETVVLGEPDSFGDPITTIVVRAAIDAAPRRPRPAGKAKAQNELLTELERRYRTGEHWWDKATVTKAGRDLGMHRNSPAHALEGLVHGGFVVGNDARMTLVYPPECT